MLISPEDGHIAGRNITCSDLYNLMCWTDFRCWALSLNCEAQLLASLCLSVRLPARNNSALTGRISWNFIFEDFFENLSRKINFHENLVRMKGTVHEDRYAFVITSRSGLELEMFQTNVVEKITKHVLCSVTLLVESRAVYEIVWKILYSGAGNRWQYGACALHAGYLRLQTHTHNM